VLCFVLLVSFFFFQAEDGIRDFHVTGVQTCALPIFTPATSCWTWIPQTKIALMMSLKRLKQCGKCSTGLIYRAILRPREAQAYMSTYLPEENMNSRKSRILATY